jgi:hypothetical protein
MNKGMEAWWDLRTMSSFSQNRKLTIIACLVLAAIGVAQLASSIIIARSSGDSDLLRQWKTSQYVRAGTNPYPVALAALRARYGVLAPNGSVHLKEIPIYGIPKAGPDPTTNAELGAPEATYPPTSAILFATCVGHLQASTVRTSWLVLNLGLLLLIVRELLLLLEFLKVSWPVAGLVGALAVAWPPVAYCFQREQFSIFVLWSVLLASRLECTRPVLAGLFWGLALIKPSLALPYLLSPLGARRWKVLALTASLQGALLAFAAMRLRETPWTLVSQWLSVAAYFRQGIYTIQELINRLHLDGTLLDSLIPIGVVGLAFCLARRLTRVRALAFLSFVSVIWMYHGIYDFVVLLVPGALHVPDLFDRRRKNMAWILSVGGFLAIGVALLPAVREGETMIYHLLRWIGRLSLAISLLIAAKPEGTGADSATDEIC